MSAAPRARSPQATARATLRRVRRRLERESARAAAFLDLPIVAPARGAERSRLGSAALPERGSGEIR